jgi:hypothetical protein
VPSYGGLWLWRGTSQGHLILFKTFVLGKKECVFFPGYVSGGKRENVGNTSTEDECAQLVTKTRPEATGATWTKRVKGCRAEFGSRIIKFGEKQRSCLFNVGKAFK